jgi:type I restriction enzyme S subunit
MKKGWEVKKLGDVCISKSSNVSQNQLANEVGDYPIFGASGLIKNVSFYHRDKSYLSIVKDGSGFGRITKMEAFTSVIGTLQYILPNDDIDLDYLNYSLMSVEFKKYVQGAAIPHIYFKDYKNEPFLWMPLTEQQRIVSILDEVFAAIAVAKDNAEQNIKNAKELFESYLQELFAKKGINWKVRKLGDIAFVKSGGTPSRAKKEFWEGDIAWYSSGELNELYTNDPERYINELAIANSNAKIFPKGSLLIGMYDTAALKMSIIDREAAFNQAIAGVKPNDKIDLTFILHSINSIKPDLLNLRRGVRQKNLSLEKIKDIPIYLPTLKDQQDIVQKLDSLSAETKRLKAIYQQKILDLEELKKSVLQKAFNGEL